MGDNEYITHSLTSGEKNDILLWGKGWIWCISKNH